MKHSDLSVRPFCTEMSGEEGGMSELARALAAPFYCLLSRLDMCSQSHSATLLLLWQLLLYIDVPNHGPVRSIMCQAY